ncbi:hypothetical protein V1527DRAFT_521913 [Lipomyces starkeyi]
MNPTELEKELEALKSKFPPKGVAYFLNQCTTSRVEGSHNALNGALTSSGTLYTARQKINYRNPMLCSAISRSALELIHTEIRYLLPCSHQIQLGVPLQVAQGALSALTVPSHNLDSSAIADIKDKVVLVKRKCRPRGTRRLTTSAEIDGSTLEEMWTDILSTTEQVTGNDGSEHAK